MKARVIATGEIKEFAASSGYYRDAQGNCYGEKELDFDVNGSDYWDKLLHQYAGMAMQAMIEDGNNFIYLDGSTRYEHITDTSIAIATALVEKLKEKEERK